MTAYSFSRGRLALFVSENLKVAVKAWGDLPHFDSEEALFKNEEITMADLVAIYNELAVMEGNKVTEFHARQFAAMCVWQRVCYETEFRTGDDDFQIVKARSRVIWSAYADLLGNC